jgi:hypothetical protein
VTYQNLTYDVLFQFEQFSLMKPGVTIEENESYKDWIIYYLKESYNEQFGDDSFVFTPGGGLFIAPMQSGTYYVSSEFAERIHPVTGEKKMHYGIDMAAPLYTPIYAAADGVVINAGHRPDGQEVGGFGNTIVIDHGSYKTLYGHVEDDGILVKVGDQVVQGQLIGGTGNQGIGTGAHLHFEICPTDQGNTWTCDGQINPRDSRFGIIFDTASGPGNLGSAQIKAKSEIFDKGKAEFLTKGIQTIMMPGFNPASTFLGSWVAQFESGSAGPASIGRDSTGGWSYGTYQLAAKKGSVKRFADWLLANNGKVYYDKLSPIEPDEDAFRVRWTDLALSDPNGFNLKQYQFIKNTYYDVSVSQLKSMTYPFDPSTRARSVQEMIWSISVQHGQGGPANFFKTVYINKGIDPNTKTDADIINDIFAERSKVDIYFKDSTSAVKQSVYNRFQAERKLLLDRLFNE